MTRSSVVFPAPLDADEPDELAAPDGEADIPQDVPPAQPHADVVHGQHLGPALLPTVLARCQRRLVHRHSLCVDWRLATAFSSAPVSASIQDW